MSANDDEEMEIPGREVAYRLFAAEYDDASVSYTESDEERAPNYVIAPTGARINRLFAVGTLTEVTSVNDEMVRARVVDPTGAFVVYAGQYQPDELAFLEGIEPPAFVAVTGKARTFQPEDSDQVYTSIRPESIATVDADTRDRWVVSAAEQTLERIELYAAAAEAGIRGDDLTDALLEQGVEPGLAAGIPLAQDHYGTTPSYLAALRDCAREAVEVVSGDRDQVGPFDAQPGETNSGYEDATFDSLANLGVDAVDRSVLESVSNEGAAGQEPAEAEPKPESESEPEPEPEAVAAAAGGDTVESSSAAGTATGEARDASSGTATETAETATDTVGDGDSGVELESEGGVDSESESEDAVESAESGPEPASESEPAADPDTAEPVDESADAAAADAGTDDELAADEPADDEELGDFDANDIGDGMYEMDDEEREQLEEEFGAEFTTGAEVEEPGEADIDVPESDDGDAEADAATDADTGAESDPADSDLDDDDDLGAPPTSGLEDEDETEAAESESELEETEAESGAETEAEPDESESEAEPESGADESEDAAADESDTDEPAADVDLQDYVVETMADLDDGDGADRTELVETVAADTGASEDEVEDAIQDALMGGQCYEPDDETLKPI
ncbi:hypothetical protein [Halopiger xanaduensis]|uniref:Rpa-associated protein n=1 Tax=Halopiger xanaduensis (strain DSM 18323 / JCM 14033 / SH-6) TaxID=797210 RepID=F8D321_HALXS|nr:hypothetical protein [Halopiger xanaduensis]AEH37305.1 conserved hypothetical protein [Halopiger xanaduensis SH-6]